MVAPSAPDASLPYLGERYEVVRRLARGGMAEVFEGQDRQLGREVAVKVLRGEAADPARFQMEAVVLAGLNHPGLVQVYDAATFEGIPYVVLELVDGPNLAECLAAEGPMEPADAARVGAQIAAALAYVHGEGVVHRDVSPANVLWDADGRVRLADFGIARLVDASRMTDVATTLGTAAYMAPEQVSGGQAGPPADIYALGLVLLELLTGWRGFEGPPLEVMLARLTRAPEIPAQVPGDWRSLIASMTATDPRDRPTAAEVCDRLERLRATDAETAVVPVTAASGTGMLAETVETPAAGGGTAVMPVPLASDGAPTRRRLWPVAIGALVAALLLVGLAAAGGDDRTGEPPGPASSTTEAVASTLPTTTTTVAPATARPTQPEGKGKGGDGNGKGKGRGRG